MLQSGITFVDFCSDLMSLPSFAEYPLHVDLFNSPRIQDKVAYNSPENVSYSLLYVSVA